MKGKENYSKSLLAFFRNTYIGNLHVNIHEMQILSDKELRAISF